MTHPTRFFIIFALLLTACGSAPAKVTSTPSPAEGTSPEPVEATPSVGKTVITDVPSQNIGNIAVRVEFPLAPRYTTSAGVVVVLSPIFTQSAGFQDAPDVTRLGLVAVSYLWPGETDAHTRAKSDGTFDYGGETSIAALRDVLRFAAGLLPDKDGRLITDLAKAAGVTALTEEVGVYAFSDAGIAAISVLALYGDQLQNVQYFVGRENPTGDSLATLELGYLGQDGTQVINPTYKYPQSYATDSITLSYTNLRWDPAYKDSLTGAAGRPYLDLNNNGRFDPGDFAFSSQVPTMAGKRYYSAALTQALLANNALGQAAWPADLATPQEAAQFWQFRQVSGRYQALGNQMPDLKVMLVFAKDDHAQVTPDKPQIHQMYQGLSYEAWHYGNALGLWVRLNPDRSYVQALIPDAGLDYPDNPAKTQPVDWLKISDYAYPDQGNVDDLVPLAGVAEMADRTHFGDWTDMNLDQVFPVTQP